MIPTPSSEPVAGKTYSLFGGEASSDTYYRTIGAIVDACLDTGISAEDLLLRLRKLSRRKYPLSARMNSVLSSTLRTILEEGVSQLDEYTAPLEEHLRSLPWRSRLEATMRLSAPQYHLLMLEIETTNRVNNAGFHSAARRLAFLPHCLHDLRKHCRATMQEIDHVCRLCSSNCFVHAVTRLSQETGVEAYIWLTADLRPLLKRLRREHGTVGVFGVACIPELVHGMRMCDKAGVPALGVPLDANRCRRWMGSFHPTSVNTPRVERLLRPVADQSFPPK